MEVPTSKPGGMLEAEFAEAVEGLVPKVSDQLCKHLFLQCLAQHQLEQSSKKQYLPVKKLSCILLIKCLHHVLHASALQYLLWNFRLRSGHYLARSLL